ncbi:methylmalonyl Co-A mutase-associated GTPase MeaB [Halovulum sp. GXIMD14793]
MITETDIIREGLLAGSRRALAKAITLVESKTFADRTQAEALLDALPEVSGTLRIGLSGAPGVGKSTFTESYGLHLCETGHKVAVLAVDPSSGRSGGSILGDKTRMERLSRHPGAFIRPTPSGLELGGVARRTREAIRLVETAGFDRIIIETVGVGQSETLVAEMTDVFLLLLAPAGGDELQGVKRGIMEVADLVIVNKADGALTEAAERARADHAGALRLMRPRDNDPEGFPKALSLSSITGHGLADATAEVEALANWRSQSGLLQTRRQHQQHSWFEEELRAGLTQRLATDPRARHLRADLETALTKEQISPTAAARQLLATLLPDT